MAKDKCWTPLQLQVRMKWLGVIQRQAEGEMGVEAFCKANTIPVSSFYKWRSEFRNYDESQMRQLSPEFMKFVDSPPAFAEVAVGEDDDDEMTQGTASGKIEIILPGGARVNVVSPVDGSSLATVLAAMNGLSDLAGGRC